MKEEVTVRPLRQADVTAVRRLDKLILGRDRSSTWDSLVKRFLDIADIEVLPHAPFGCHVAEWQGELVGFILSEHQNGEYGLPRGVWVIAVAVNPEMRRMGIGRKLVDALIAQCRQEGIEEIYGTVRPGDELVERFYAACGLQPSRIVVFGRRV